MRRRFTYLLIAAFLLTGSVEAFADRHEGKERDRKEQRDNRGQGNNHRPGNNGNRNNGSKKDKNHKDSKDNKHNDKYIGKPGNSGRPGGNTGGPGNSGKPGGPGHPGGYAPGGVHHGGYGPAPASMARPGAGGHFHPGPATPPPPPPRLPHMVNHATRGCHDVAVWQVSPDTYIVKYRKGRRWYTRYVYPYENRYGAPSLISVNWQPMSPWTLIPPIQLNINL